MCDVRLCTLETCLQVSVSLQRGCECRQYSALVTLLIDTWLVQLQARLVLLVWLQVGTGGGHTVMCSVQMH